MEGAEAVQIPLDYQVRHQEILSVFGRTRKHASRTLLVDLYKNNRGAVINIKSSK